MKFFLSHSSRDKAYVRQVADRLGDRAIFDEYTFEAGMKTLDEIFRTLDTTEIFVLFISDAALKSDWVRAEITNGKALLDADRIKRFVPILIDRTIKHEDPRIPEWMRQNYNIRLVAKPTVALRRLNTVLAQLSLEKHPGLMKRDQMFVGRNSELSQFEQRIDDYAKPVPTAIIVSGLRDVGRKTFLMHALRKSNKIAQAYQPMTITLQPEDGIDGFISKVYDLGYFPEDIDLSVLSTMNLDGKQVVLSALLSELFRQNEVLLVDDWRCIVRYGGELAEWFLPLCNAIPQNHIVLAIVSATRPKISQGNSRIFSVRLRELDPDERIGLLVRYLRDIEARYDIDPNDYEKFRPILNGYPEQAIYAGQLIATEGLAAATLRANDILEFSRLKASFLIEGYLEDPGKAQLLEFLSWFEFASLDMIAMLAEELKEPLMAHISEFIGDSVCDLIGSVGEYVRLNDIMRDFVSRGSFEIPRRYAAAIAKMGREMFHSGMFMDYDYSEKAAVVRVSLLEGKGVPEKFLIPAHVLAAISQKYKNRKYKDVIELCDMILARDNYEDYIKSQVRHYLCMALARSRDARFLTEVQRIKGEEHNYVLGFYYRVMGRYEDALERFGKAIADGRWEENSKREIVLIHNIMENYDEARELAKESYIKYPWNAVTIQAYFEVLLNLPRTASTIAEIQSTIEAVGKVSGDKAEEVGICMKGRYAFHIEGRPDKALAILDQGISRFHQSPYPLLAKLEIGVSMRNIRLIDETLAELKASNFRDGGPGKVQVVKAEIMSLALSNQKGKALAKIDSELGFIFPAARERFRQRILDT